MKFADIRLKIWGAATSRLPEGTILPWWALSVRALLFPIDFLFWRLSKTRGYQWQNDTWFIEGVTYSARALVLLSQAKGQTYRVSRTGDVVTLEHVTDR